MLWGSAGECKSSHVHTFGSLPQPPEKIHAYIREIFDYLYFLILTLFNFFNECVERGAVNSNDKVVAMYLLYGSPIQKPKYHFDQFLKPTQNGI
jgi:hypothetical protein